MPPRRPFLCAAVVGGSLELKENVNHLHILNQSAEKVVDLITWMVKNNLRFTSFPVGRIFFYGSLLRGKNT